MTRSLLATVALLTCAFALRAPTTARSTSKSATPRAADREAALVVDGITDTARGDVVTPAELAARLDGVRLVFVGESHTDAEFHRVQLRVIQELHKRGRQVLVGLEMYPATAAEQEWLDRWRSDKGLGEEAFVAGSHWYRSWGYHWNYYREIFLFAREQRDPPVRRERAARGGADGANERPRGAHARASARCCRRASTPTAPSTSSLFRAFFGEADALHGNMPDAMFQGMYRAQCTWDAAMGWNALQALRTHGGDKAIMVVLVGSGHVAYGLGAERQARLWFDGRTASVIPVSVREEEGGPLVTKVQASYADFVWGLPPTTDPLYPSVGLSTPEQKSGERYKVIAVVKGSPAAAAGFQVGDELVSIDGAAVRRQGDGESVARGEALGRPGGVQGAARRPGAGAHGPAAEAENRSRRSDEARAGRDGGAGGVPGMPGEAEGDGEPGVGQRGREGRLRGGERGAEERDGLRRGEAAHPRGLPADRGSEQEREGVHQHLILDTLKQQVDRVAQLCP